MIRRMMLNAFKEASTTPKVIQLFFLGDSITRGIGTTGSGFTNTTGSYGGAASYPQQTLSNITNLSVTAFVRGWSGETAEWFNSNDLQRTISLFDYDNYTDIYCVVYFGTNDLCLNDVATFQSNITTTCSALKAAGAKVILLNNLSRKDSYAASIDYVNITRRNAWNTWLTTNYATICDAFADLSIYPNLFGDDAPDNATYFNASDIAGDYKLHPTDAGAALIGIAVAQSIKAISSGQSKNLNPTNDAANFISATGITDSNIILAVNSMVNSLKTGKLWHKFDAIYPFVGGSPGTHKFNLKDPRDLDEAFRLIYTGSALHDSSGVTWSSGSYADTRYVQLDGSDFSNSNRSLHYYSRTIGNRGIDIGSFDSNGNRVCWLGINMDGSCFSVVNNYAGGVSASFNESGLFTTSRANSDFRVHNLFRNGELVQAFTEDVSFNAPISSFTIGINNGGLDHPSPRNCAYAAIGYGLTQAEETLHYSIIQAFQTSLGRQV